jgi:hypothetical protein
MWPASTHTEDHIIKRGILGSSTTEGLVIMLGIGLFALALNTLRSMTTPN